MRVEISSKAERYIKEKGSPVIVKRIIASGCCVGTVPVFEVELGSPEDLSRYEKEIVSDVTLFIDKAIDKEKKLTIDMVKLLGLKKFLVELV